MSAAPDTYEGDGGPPAASGGPLRRPTREEAKRLYARCKKTGEAVAKKYRTLAEINEAFYAGDQWSIAVTSKGGVKINHNAWFDAEKVPRLAVNLFTGLLMTWSALLTKDRPTAKAVAASDEPINTYRAALAQKIIEFLEEEVDSAGKIMDTVQLAGLGGTAGLKIVYLPDDDRISWAPVSVHDFLIDPHCPDWRDAAWVIFTDHISVDDAEQLLMDDGVEDPRVNEEPYNNAANESLHGVPRAEFWYRPTRKYPLGFYACFVGDECVDLQDYPIAVDDDSGKPRYLLPIVLMRVRQQRGSVYGNTNFSDAVPLQRALNENVSRQQKILRTTSAIHLKMPKSLAKGFKPGEASLITFNDAKADAAKAIDFTRPPEPSQAIFAMRDFLAAAMEKVVGLNSTTTGTQSSSLSGRAIENLVQLDEDRNADVERELFAMIEEAYRLSLVLVRLCYSVLRQRKITNGDVAELIAFQGADLEGVDVRLEPSSEIDDLSSVKEQAAAERVNAGLAGPLAIPNAQNDPRAGASRAIAEQMIRASLNGQQITELPGDLNFDAVDDVIAKYKAAALAKQDMGLWIAVDRFRKEVEDLRNRADNLAPPGATPQPAPGAPGAQPA